MAITLNSTTLITNPGKFAQFDAHKLKRLLVVGLAASNNLHCGGSNYLSNAGWRSLGLSANTALLGATSLQCQIAMIQLHMENGGLVTAATPPTDAQILTILQSEEQLQAWPDDQLDRMLMYLLGVQASTINGL